MSDVHYTTSWLDNVLWSQAIPNRLDYINIIDKLPSSDHLPLSITFDVQLQFTPANLSSCSSPRAKVIYNWVKAIMNHVNDYCLQTYNNFAKINIVPDLKCTNGKCKSIDHRNQIDSFYSQICDTLQCSGLDYILSSKPNDSDDFIVLGFNDYVKDLHSVARSDYVSWRDAGKPRSGSPCRNMRRYRLTFKYALRQCKKDEDAIRSDQYAKSLLHKDMVSF